MQPQLNGWAFPNFPSATFPDLNFDTADLVSMFGSGPAVCVDGVADPCTLTAEAAAWARMVNQARATGHCEGLVALASARFNKAELPETVKLPSQEDEIRAVMRAFATQFVPEVQDSIQKWTKASLSEKVDELKRSFAADKLEYTLGVYVESGGHAVLPYAIEYPTPDVARIMVYDSNWPGRNRYVDVDLKAEKWTFSFAGDDPANDPNLWSGGSGDMDLTPFEAREGTCPFCGDDTKVQATTMLVRTENLDWAVETPAGAVSPTQATNGDGAAARPVKGSVVITRLSPRATARSSYDFMITIPNDVLEGVTSTSSIPNPSTTAPASDGSRAKLLFGGAASVFAVTPGGVAQFSTPGSKDKPVEVGARSIKSNDPNVDLTFAAGNLVANASGPTAELGASDEGTLAVQVTTSTGEVIQQQVTPDAPAVQVKADETGAVTVLQASSTGEVQKTEIAADGTKTETVVDASELNLNKVEVELPPALESKAIEALPKLEDRNLNNPTYKADEAYVPPSTVPAPKENAAAAAAAAAATSTTAARGETASTVQTRNAALPNATTTTAAARPGSAPTTTNPRSVSAAGATPTTVAAVVRPTITNFRIATKTFGDDAFTLDPPDSNSPGGFRYSSSRTDVATVSATTGRVTIVGAGSTVITATQSAARGFEAATITATLIVGKAKPSITPLKDVIKTFGDDPFTVGNPVSDSTGAFTYSSSNEDVLKQSRVTGRWVIGGAGRATVTVTQASTDDFLAGSDSFVATVRKGTPELKAPADVSKAFLDADFDLPRPTSDSKGAFTYTSSDVNIVSVADGKASIKAAGTVTITASQATTDDWLAASSTFKIIVAAKAPTLSDFADVSKTFGDAAFSLVAPKSNSSGAFTYKSSDDKVVTVGEADGKVTVVGAGSATITASQAATSGFSAGSIGAKVTVGKADPGISDLVVGDKAFGDDDFTLKPTAKSGGVFTYSTDKTDVFTVDAKTGVVKIVGVGTATLTARVASTTNYEAGAVSASVTVKKGTPTLAWSLDPKTFGDAPFQLGAPVTKSDGTFSYLVSTADAVLATVTADGKVTIKQAGSVTIAAKQASTTLWNEASTTAVLTIDKAVPTLSGFAIPAKTFGDAPFMLTAPTSNVPQSVAPFTYEVVSPTGATCSNSTSSVTSPGVVASVTCGTGQVTVSGVGSVQIRARQQASTNYTTASITTTLTVAKASQQSPITDGLVAKWSFDSLSTLGTNSVGSGNLVPTGGPLWTASGKVGGALSLNGTSAYLPSATGTVTGLPVGNGTYSVSAWFNASELGDKGIVGWGNYWSTRRVIALRLMGTSGFRHYWWGADLDPVASLQTGRWYHVVATFNGTTRAVYLDGSLLRSDTPGANNATATNFAVGKTFGNEYFKGLLDEVAIYNRALTTSEIGVLASGGDAGIVVTSSSANAGSLLTLSTSGGKGSGAVSFSLVPGGTGSCSLTGAVLTSSTAGTCIVTATKNGDALYEPSTSLPTAITFNKIAQTSAVVVTSLSATAGTNLTLTASGGSGSGAYSFFVASPGATGCTVQSGVLVTTGTGTCVVYAKRSSDVTYLEATSSNFSVTVQGTPPTLSSYGPTASGLSGIRYVGYFNDDVNWFNSATPHGDTHTTTDFSWFTSSQPGVDVDSYSWEWKGEFLSSSAGSYQFCVTSDDASYFWLGNTAASGFTADNALVKMPSIHPHLTPDCATITLAAGVRYPVRVQFGENDGGDAILLSFAPPGGSLTYNFSGYFFSNGSLTKRPGELFTPTLPTSNSNGAITYISSNPSVATVNSSTGAVTPVSLGTTVLTANQAASGMWTTASRSFELKVAKGDQSTVSITSGTSGTLATPISLTATGGSTTAAFTFALSGGGSAGCSISGTSLSATAEGTCAVVATRPGDSAYNAASSAPTTVTFVKANQSAVSVTSTSGVVGTPLSLTATGGSTTAAFTFALSGGGGSAGCLISGTSLSATAEGTCAVVATRPGDSAYNAASSAPTTVTVSRTAYSVLTDFVSGPASQVSTNTWQYLEVPSARSSVTLLSDWQPSGNEVISGESQWDNNRLQYGGPNYPFVQRVSTAPASSSMTGSGIVIHPDDSSLGVGVAWTNTSAASVLVELSVGLKLAYPTWNHDGIDFWVQRGLVGSGNYQLINSGSIMSGDTSTASSSAQSLSVPGGESIYVIVDRRQSYVWDHTILTFNVKKLFGDNVVRPGLVSYLDASNTMSYTGSGTSWADLSGNGKNATLVGVTHNSAGYMVFSGAAYADWGQPLETGSSYSIDAWVWQNSTAGHQNIASTNQTPFWFSGGELRGGIAGNYQVVSNPSTTINSWMHVAVTFDDPGNVMKLFLNGTQVASSSAHQTFVKQWLTIGAHNNGTSATSNLNGRIGSIRLYNRALTAAEVLQNYSATERACATSACSSLSTWFDAAESSTVTTSGTSVASMSDRSDGDLAISQSDPNRRPIVSSTLRNGRKFLTFDGGDVLASTPFTQSLPVTIFAVARSSVLPAGINRQIVGNGGTTPAVYMVGGEWRIFAGSELGTGTTSDTNWHFISGVFDGANSRLYVDGQLANSGNVGSFGWNPQTFMLGNSWENGWNYGWVGDIGEVMVYSKVLTDAERQHTEGYLARKWGFSQ
ncbi:MAG: hypothetical protein RLZZ199_219 [Actinomycetota bacterium]|jgi:uncharacterized protein YjdB